MVFVLPEAYKWIFCCRLGVFLSFPPPLSLEFGRLIVPLPLRNVSCTDAIRTQVLRHPPRQPPRLPPSLGFGERRAFQPEKHRCGCLPAGFRVSHAGVVVKNKFPLEFYFFNGKVSFARSAQGRGGAKESSLHSGTEAALGAGKGPRAPRLWDTAQRNWEQRVY